MSDPNTDNFLDELYATAGPAIRREIERERAQERERRSAAPEPEPQERRNAVVQAMYDDGGQERLVARIPTPPPVPIRPTHRAHRTRGASMAAPRRANPFRQQRVDPNPPTVEEIEPDDREGYVARTYVDGRYSGLSSHDIQWLPDPTTSECLGALNASGPLAVRRRQIQPFERALGSRRGCMRHREGRGFTPGGFGDEDDEQDRGDVEGMQLSFEGEMVLKRAGWRAKSNRKCDRVDAVVGRAAEMLHGELDRYLGRAD